jgi:hypothetical protein
MQNAEEYAINVLLKDEFSRCGTGGASLISDQNFILTWSGINSKENTLLMIQDNLRVGDTWRIMTVRVESETSHLT